MQTKLISFIRYLVFNKIAASKLTPKRIRIILYNWGGMEIKTGSVCPGCFMGSSNIKIDSGTFVNYNCFFDSLAPITIGKDCLISMEVLFCTSTHKILNEKGKSSNISESIGFPITVEDNCWIGARATILPGVNITEGCVIAAGAVVTKNCSVKGLYAGIPAKRVKDFN